MAKTEVGDCREGKGAVQGSPPSAPWVQHPSHRSLSPGSAWLPTTQPRAALSLFLGTQGGFLLPPCKPLCLEERGDKGRGEQGTAKPARPQHPQELLSLPGSGQSCAQRQEPARLIHHAHGRGTATPCPKPGSAPRVITWVSVFPFLPSGFRRPSDETRQLRVGGRGEFCPVRRRRRQ